ncbi:hypothetical protein OBBRIDRAFT_794195 [Obba rivulosa]|uniref:FHA domain-containing protein n=1 Tax=Obba rivulosa TaxID=1052685 RepID=A0A8E2AUL9_9APHY|nr:hypothetical protein OBBRIDRAFT_794195 [Obba rivulosa]
MVDAHGDEPAESLTFYKSQTRAVHIGRKSGQPCAKARTQDVDSALFRCPVISRKHAKITFTDFGNAYIIDLNSHHGTYVLRPGELVSSAIKPEVPTVLADGDILTFGKIVGRDEHLVRPVTVRVQLIYGAAAASPFMIEKNLSSSTSKNSSSENEQSDNSPTRSGTGRYGVYSTSSESSNSEHDSDEDEPEEPSAYGMQYRPVLPMRSGRLALLRRVLPPIHIGPLELASPVSGSPRPHVAPLCLPSEAPAQDTMDGGSSNTNNANEASSAPGAWPMSPMEISPLSSPSVLPAQSEPQLPASLLDDFAEWFVPSVPSEQPSSPHRSPSPVFSVAASEHEPGTRENAIDLESFPSPFMNGAPLFSRETSDESVVEVIKDGPSAVQDIAHDRNRPASPDLKPAFINQINDAFIDIAVLQNSRRKNEELFDAHVQTTKMQISELDKQIHDVNLRVTTTIAATDVQMASVTSRLGDLNNEIARVEALRAEVMALPIPVPEPSQVDTMRAILDEMKALRAHTQQQVELELEALKAIRSEAEAAAAQMYTDINETSLKRKRCVEEEETSAAVYAVHEPVVERKTKRRKAMEVASKIAHTAAVAGVGAVAAWAALAFS